MNQNEIWKAVVGYEGIYEVSSLGRVRSLDRVVKHPKGGYANLKSKVISQKVRNNGYLEVCLHSLGITKSLLVHRIVANSFIINIDNKPQINHINAIKDDNRIDNLEWVTDFENQVHKTNNKLNPFGENHKKSKLKEFEVLSIRESNENNNLIAKKFNVSRRLISSIKNRKIWKHI